MENTSADCHLSTEGDFRRWYMELRPLVSMGMIEFGDRKGQILALNHQR